MTTNIKKDDLVIINSGGWGYNPSNNGCIGIVLNTTKVDASIKTLNPKRIDQYTTIANVPIRTLEKIGYDEVKFELIKDIPAVKAGTIFTYLNDINWGEEKKGGRYSLKYLTDTNWFKPFVTRNKSKKITIGNKDVEVVIFESGAIQFQDRVSHISTVEALRASFDHESIRVGNFSTSIDEDVRFIRIGCEEENNLFSLTDLDMVITTYKSLKNA